MANKIQDIQTHNPALDRIAVHLAQEQIDNTLARSILRHPSLSGSTDEEKQYVIDRILTAKAVLTSE